MAYLTQLGFLEQRHTSGGRVPSKTSFRYYVDNIMKEKPISEYEMNKINEALSVNSGDPERLLLDACKLLEEYSHCAAFCATLEDPYDCIPALTSLCALCDEASHSKLSLEGETNLLSHEELGSDLYKILGLLTGKKQLMELSKRFANSNHTKLLMIGDENPLYEMKNTSTLIAKFNYEGGQKAVLGVIGSMRIDYESILPKIKYIINTVDTLLSKKGA